jgi:adenylyltransferase/sulfurtransferase
MQPISASAAPDPRYHRQVILPGVGLEGQRRLQRARVLVIGMGGLGSPASLYLAAAGVGTVGLADPDRVELSNLHRQILHDTAGAGSAKIDSARERLHGLNPEVELELHPDGVTPGNALSLFSRYDLIVDGSDNFPTRYLVNDAACLAGIPVVYGSIFQYEGQVSVFDPAHGTPCYRCLFPEPPEPGTVPNCAEAGVFGALCGIVGSWQASEAIKWIIGIGEPLAGRIKVLDTLSGRDRIVALKQDPSCPLCGAAASIRSIRPDAYRASCPAGAAAEAPHGALPLEIDPASAARLRAAAASPLFVDVREDYERQMCRIGPDELHLPTGEVQFKWRDLPRDRHLIIYCHHGMRSLFVARFLQEKGLSRVQSLHGGIEAWSRTIDPAVPRY